MKLKTLMIATLLTVSAFSVKAQSVNDIFDPQATITWVGLDMTGAIFIGDREKFGSQSDIQNLIKSWNDVLEREKDKFNVQTMLHKKTPVELKLDITRNHNSDLDISNILSEKSSDHIHLRKDGVEQIAASYNFDGAKGIGLMFNVETFNKTNNEASVWVTFIDMATNEVLITERVTGHPGGGGIRNYWLGAINEIMAVVRKKEFEVWRKKYQRK
jgi:hypothetical protein